jgi:Icc-related predicted phosphoesterase
MKLHILSDLHLSVSGMVHPITDADVVVLAGDIARPRDAVAWALGFDKPVLYVPGNHEFYGGSLDATVADLKSLSRGSHVQVLDDDELVLGGVRFLGSTLWTDMRLYGDGAAGDAALLAAQRMMRDFARIRVSDSSDALFTPADAQARHARHRGWLERRLAAPHAGATVVITHHAPSPRSIAARFAGSPLNACFVSDAETLLGGERVPLWVHGHTHDSFDYRLHGTRVLCNPRGYARNGVNENARFDPALVVEV